MSVKYLLSPYFSLNLNQQIDQVVIKMEVLTSVMNTAELPETYHILRQLLPRVLKTRCFNPGNLSFSKEVKQTEIGHLFEHILLEYLCQAKLASGLDEVTVRGDTSWDWINTSRGTFKITINSALEDSQILAESLTKTIKLANLIMTSGIELNPIQQMAKRPPTV